MFRFDSRIKYTILLYIPSSSIECVLMNARVMVYNDLESKLEHKIKSKRNSVLIKTVDEIDNGKTEL